MPSTAAKKDINLVVPSVRICRSLIFGFSLTDNEERIIFNINFIGKGGGI